MQLFDEPETAIQELNGITSDVSSIGPDELDVATSLLVALRAHVEEDIDVKIIIH